MTGIAKPKVESVSNLPQLPSPPPFRDRSSTAGDDQVDRRSTLRTRLGKIYQSLCSPSFVNSITAIPKASEHVERLKQTIFRIDTELTSVPTIKVALLGPSRHGKSTLLNALAGCSILPMSDVKPCTASIVSLKREDEWTFRIEFISRKRLERERQRAVDDARDYLARCAQRMMGDDEPDDPRYLHSTLQRFIQLFAIDSDLPPVDLVNAIANATIPPHVDRLLGQIARPRSSNVEQMQQVVERYLSTKDTLWTIVDTCEISGPFQNWHPNLQFVDLPGTNDTDPQRTQITNSLQRTAKAVAICTSDSNLGNDIQSWLRNSSVLGDFLEATEQSRQHLFILRTKFDAYHPEIDDLDTDDDVSEEQLYRQAIERHKQHQTESYREMFRSIASPLLPLGNSSVETRQREEMLERINSIQVFFVSALAHEAFEGRLKATRGQKRRLSEHFHDDPAATGIPALKAFANTMAETYLSRFYYDDMEYQLETEVDRLVRFFCQQWSTLAAELGGGSQALANLVDRIESRILPWLTMAVSAGSQQFQRQVSQAGDGIADSLRQIQNQLKERLSHRQRKWARYYWNTLQAAARKRGVHMTSHGEYVDINQDICGIFVDGLSISWSSYRDRFIQHCGDAVADELLDQLQTQLDAAAADVDVPEATAAIDAIVTHLSTVARAERENLRREVDAGVHELESIRKPAYEAVQSNMLPVYDHLASESGPGCQERMRGILSRETSTRIGRVWQDISDIILNAVRGLENRTSQSLGKFGQAAEQELRSAVEHLKEIGNVTHRQRVLEQLEHIYDAALELWNGISEAFQTILYLPAPQIPQTDTSSKVLELADTRGQFVAQLVEQPGPSHVATSAELRNGLQDLAPSEYDEDSEPTVDPMHPEVAEQTTLCAAPLAGQMNEAAPESLLDRLVSSPVFQRQKEQSGRAAPDQQVVGQILETLRVHHWRMTVPAISESVAIPTFRLRSILPGIQRILNLDAQPIMAVCRKSDTVEINESLLQQEFSL